MPRNYKKQTHFHSYQSLKKQLCCKADVVGDITREIPKVCCKKCLSQLERDILKARKAMVKIEIKT